MAEGDTKDQGGANVPESKYTAYYAQAGIGITPRLWANVQYEYNQMNLYGVLPSPPFPSPDIAYDNIKDTAFGLSYRFSPSFVVKGEYHTFEGYQVEGGFPINPATGEALPPKKTNYFILSVATAF